MAEFNAEEAKDILKESGTLDSINDRIEAERKISQLEADKINLQLLLREQSDIIKMRRRWSNWLLGLIVSIVLFDFLIIILVGFNVIRFQQGYIVPFFVGESLIKTLGLAIIVVNFLFDKNKSKV